MEQLFLELKSKNLVVAPSQRGIVWHHENKREKVNSLRLYAVVDRDTMDNEMSHNPFVLDVSKRLDGSVSGGMKFGDVFVWNGWLTVESLFSPFMMESRGFGGHPHNESSDEFSP